MIVPSLRVYPQELRRANGEGSEEFALELDDLLIFCERGEITLSRSR